MRVVRGLLRRPVYASALTLVLSIGLGRAYRLCGVIENYKQRKPREVLPDE